MDPPTIRTTHPSAQGYRHADGLPVTGGQRQPAQRAHGG